MSAEPDSQPPHPQIVVQQQTFTERHGIHPALFGFLCLGGVFFLYQIVGGIVTYIVLGPKPTGENVLGFRIATGAGQLVLLFLPVFLFVRLTTMTPKDYLRVRMPDPRAFIAPIIGIFSLQQIFQIYLIFQDKIPIPAPLEPIIKNYKDLIEEVFRVLIGAKSMPELFLVLVVIALIPAVSEEFLFRGLVQRSFEKGLTPMGGVVVTGIIFGLYHLNLFSLVPLVGLGIYLGFLAMRADSIWVSVAAHFLNNAAACIAVYFHQDGDALITGDPHEMSTITLLAQALLFGTIFILSTYYFLHVTRRTTAVSAVDSAVS